METKEISFTQIACGTYTNEDTHVQDFILYGLSAEDGSVWYFSQAQGLWVRMNMRKAY